MSMPRITWAQLPSAVRSAVFEATGPVLAAQNASDGVNSAIAARLRTQQGDVFVKGVPLDHPQIRTQQREADINPFLPASCPRLLWRVCAGGWDLLGFELLDARRADYQPGSPDLPLVVAALTELSATPTPDVPLKRVEDRWAAYASADELPLLAGDALLHTDIAPHNVLVNDRAYLIDWAWPTLGPAWVDPAVWLIRLIDAGHTPAEAETWAGHLPSWHQASPKALTAFAHANARMWSEIECQSGATWTKKMAASAHAWAAHRDLAGS
jgi:hypothetical protein